MPKQCQLCGGPMWFLGRLGGMAHAQCRDCGMQFMEEVGEDCCPGCGEELDTDCHGRRYCPVCDGPCPHYHDGGW